MTVTAGQPTPTPEKPRLPGTGFGIAALILGIVALVFAFIPFLDYASWILAVLGLIFGIVGVTRKERRHGTSLVGLIISVIALILTIIMAIVYTSAFANAVSSSLKVGAGTHTVEYSVTDDKGGKADITYDAINGSGNDKSTQATYSVPFDKKETFKSTGTFDISSFSLLAQSKSESSTTITCQIKVDGKVVGHGTASGSFATTSCSASK
jgi:hypothetical protein